MRKNYWSNLWNQYQILPASVPVPVNIQYNVPSWQGAWICPAKLFSVAPVYSRGKKSPVRFDSIPIIIIIELFGLFSKCVKVREAHKQMEMTLLFIVKTKQES